ncbi:MAG: hypothetical protein LBF51_08335 [Zoogloeaceae bacterium]|jgi:hypothetical protein|nr:hypothetical protein [Zoogloeaceae bacterium]
MNEIPLEAIPNQKLSVLLDEAWHDITLKTLKNGACVVSIARDGQAVIEGARACPNRALIPYRHAEGDAGNFAFLTEGGDYPQYDQFGTSQRLIYASAEELARIRGNG